MIAIVDYGMGNLRSVQKGLEKVGAEAEIVRTPEEVRAADKVILPGVGAFRDAIGNLKAEELVEPLVESVRAGKPFLGICLGLQLLFEVSYEEGEFAGLGIVPGKVVRFDFSHLKQNASPACSCSGGQGCPSAAPVGIEMLKVPHMGWNAVRWQGDCPLLAGQDSGTYFYFVHSYYVSPSDPAVAFGQCHYGYDFTAMIWRDNLYATQFHPEKSQKAGLKILENFAAL